MASNIPPRPAGIKLYGMFVTPPNGGTTTWYDDTFSLANGFDPHFARTKALGLNCVVVFGSVLSGKINLSDYIAKRRLVMQRAADYGLYVVTMASFHPHDWGASVGTVSVAEATPVFQADIAACAQFPNCSIYIIADEPYESIGHPITGYTLSATNAEIVALGDTLYAALRPLAPANLPIMYGPLIYGAQNAAAENALMSSCDCAGFHMNGQQQGFNAWDTFLTDNPGKTLFFSEVGDLPNGDSRIPAFYGDYFFLTYTYGPVRGFGLFTSTDYTGSNSGVWDRGGAPYYMPGAERTEKTNELRAGIANAVAVAPISPRRPSRIYRGKPSLNDKIRWMGP